MVGFLPNSGNFTDRFSKLFIPLLPLSPKTFAGKEEELGTISRQNKTKTLTEIISENISEVNIRRN